MHAGHGSNIMFFFSDQQRWDTAGCYGQALDVTPNLDRMAAEGVRFENAFTCQPVCGPARAAIQTGKYASETGCVTNHVRLPADEKTIAHYLAEAGYETAYIGKWHLSSQGPKGGADDFRERAVPPERRGGYQFWVASDTLEFTSHSYDGHMFDTDGNKVFMPAGRYRADWLTDIVIDYLKNRKSEKPFFLMVSYIEPHHQNDHNCYEGPKGSKERFKDFKTPGDLVDTEGDWRENYPDYLGCCASLDENLGRIREALKELGIAENTNVLYTSDHGSHFRTRNGEYKRSCHDGCTRIPMVAYGPDFKGGKVVSELVSLVSVPPTILKMGGVTVPEYMRGRPLQEVVHAAPGDWPEEIFMEISESQFGRAVRTKKWKYSVAAPRETGSNKNNRVYIEEFLYDLENDPHEKNNLVSDPSLTAIRAELAAGLVGSVVANGEITPEIFPRDT